MARVVTYFRDNNGMHILDALLTMPVEVTHFGLTPTDALVHGKMPGTLRIGRFSKDLFPAALRAADAVITSAGSNILSECVHLKKPVFALTRPWDAEQRLNAACIVRAGAGMSGIFGQLQAEQLRTFLAWARRTPSDTAMKQLMRLPTVEAGVTEAVQDLTL